MDSGVFGRGRHQGRRPFISTSSADNRQNLALTHQQVFFPIDFNLFPGVTGEKNAIAFLHLQSDSGPVVGQPAISNGHHLAASRTIFRRIGQQNSTSSPLLRLFSLNHQTIPERLQLDFGLGFVGRWHLISPDVCDPLNRLKQDDLAADPRQPSMPKRHLVSETAIPLCKVRAEVIDLL
jgi:hypothetical protein